MDTHEAERIQADGERLLEQLGDVPVAYGFACELPAVHGEPLSELDKMWYDRFEHGSRLWMVILNGKDKGHFVESLNLNVPPGAAVVVCDGTRLATVTPVGLAWLIDPDTGDPLEPGFDTQYWDDLLIEALHSRLTEKGKDLPDLQEIVSKEN